MKLAKEIVREDGTKVFTLGPIKQLRPVHRWMWHVLYAKFGWNWVYRYLWRRYAVWNGPSV